MDIIRLREGEAGSVRAALLNFDAVILPQRIINHNEDLDCSLVFDSTICACRGVVARVNCSATLSSSPYLYIKYSGFCNSDKQTGRSSSSGLGI